MSSSKPPWTARTARTSAERHRLEEMAVALEQVKVAQDKREKSGQRKESNRLANAEPLMRRALPISEKSLAEHPSRCQQVFNKIKHYKAVATRFDKLANTFLAVPARTGQQIPRGAQHALEAYLLGGRPLRPRN